MVEDKLLKARGKTLEASFFAQESERLLEKMREEAARGSRREALAAASGISDSAVLDDLEELDLSAETVAAMTLVPLIRVAWADGRIQDRERDAILRVAEDKGIAKDSAAHELLEQWLQKQPRSQVLDSWRAYALALLEAMHDEARETLRATMLANARAVAEAARSLLGLGAKVSSAEAAELDDLEKALS
jgi:uncharacterized tellurite resistance protein B-like protein